MLTPAFDITQTQEFLEVAIKAPYSNVSEAEVYIEECEFKFYAKPYYLRLNLPGPVLDDQRAVANYNSSKGTFLIKIPKANPGEVFEGLDLLTQLLSPVKKAYKNEPTIEVISSDDSANPVSTESEEDCEEEFDWQIEQIPYSEPSISVDGPKYGFASLKSGVFTRLQSELHDIIDLPDADNTVWSDRTLLREKDEQSHFDEDHYMADFCDNDFLENLLNFTPDWELESQEPVSFTDDEKEKMRKLPRKEYLLDGDARHQALLSLVDILFAYAYNHRTTEGENTVESAWTISKLSSTLSWLQIHTNLKDTMCCCIRRCVTYPLYRNWSLALKVFKDVQNIFSMGQNRALKCLLEVHSLLNESDPRYVLNDLYITDFCVWIQTLSQKHFRSMARHLRQLKISKGEVGFELELLERVCTMTNDEHIDDVRDQLENLTVEEGDKTEKKLHGLSDKAEISPATAQINPLDKLSDDIANSLDLASSSESETSSEYSDTETSNDSGSDSDCEGTKTETSDLDTLENDVGQFKNGDESFLESDEKEEGSEGETGDLKEPQNHGRVELANPAGQASESIEERHKTNNKTKQCKSNTCNIDAKTLMF